MNSAPPPHRLWLPGTLIVLLVGGCESPTEPITPSSTLLSAGLGQSCALARTGELFCWGDGIHGQLGVGGRQGSAVPVPVEGGHSFAGVSAGYRHTCALGRTGELFCWGSDEHGQLGPSLIGHDPTTSPPIRSLPARVSGDRLFTRVTSGYLHTCALADTGEIHCWGSNAFGQLGTGGGEGGSRVIGTMRFDEVSAGNVHACAIAESGETFCWGSNQYGQLGTGDMTGAAAPVLVQG
ncbi:MAG: hypothetical protein EA350_00645, partial [Gemmatimonadales bacterium]